MSNVAVHNQVTLGLRKDKSLGWSYFWLFVVGFLGVHQFYMGKWVRGILYFFTLGFFTLALWWDLFTLPSQLRQINTQRRVGLR